MSTAIAASTFDMPQSSAIPKVAWLALMSGFLGWTFDSMDIESVFTGCLPHAGGTVGHGAIPARFPKRRG